MAGLGLVGLVGVGGWQWSRSFHPSVVYRGHSIRVTAVNWSADSKRVASGDLSGSIRIWEMATGKTLLAYQGHTDNVTVIAWSPSGRLVASAGGTSEVKVWDTMTGDHVVTYQEHVNGITVLSWSPDSKYIASGSYDNTVHVWDPVTGKRISTFVYTAEAASSWVEDIAWSPNGKQIASVGSQYYPEKQFFIWDAHTGSIVLTPQGYLAGGRFSRVAWSADSRRICVFSEADMGQDDWPTTGQVWDTTTGKVILTSPSIYTTNMPQNVAWLPDGKRIVFTTLRNVWVWDTTRRHFWTSPSFSSDTSISHYFYLANIMVSSPDKKYTAGDNNNEVLIWEVPYG